MLGLFAFFYVCLHVAMYVAVDQRFNWPELWKDLTQHGWIIVGCVAFVLLIPLAITSTKSAMRQLGRQWQRLHAAIYVATLGGCWHYYWQVKRDVRPPLAYAAMFALLMGWRIIHRWRQAQRLRVPRTH